MQPYEGGIGNLYHLHLMDRTDKHRLLVPTSSSGYVADAISFAAPTGAGAEIRSLRFSSVYSYGEPNGVFLLRPGWNRSEEHTSELQSLMRISYAVFCLKKK